MKKLFLLLVVAMMAATATIAQNSGLGFNYQAVVRKADGTLLANADVNLRVSLYPGQSATSPTWVETHKVHTDYSGCFGVTVGKGTRASGSVAAKYADINFAAVYYWMKIEIQEGASYREVSFAQLPSSPYSEVAYNAYAIPAGTIVPFAGPIDKIPAGWLFCDGRAVSRTTYKKLYDAIGTCWGTGNGTTTFNLPDCRGLFLRGLVGPGNGADPDKDTRVMITPTRGGNTGNNVGSYQSDAIRNITGKIDASQQDGPCQSFGEINSANITGAFKGIWGSQANTKDGGYANMMRGFYFDASLVVPTASDNRPKNVYVTYIVKY